MGLALKEKALYIGKTMEMRHSPLLEKGFKRMASVLVN